MSVASIVLRASVQIGATPDEVRCWFFSLREHPERYQSGTHSGFAFTEGSFGEPGARFETRERLAGLPIRLSFELTAVETRRFEFRLRRPPLAVRGTFQIESTNQGAARLSLLVRGEGHFAVSMLRFAPVRHAVRQQIQREVSHIQSSVERLRRGSRN